MQNDASPTRRHVVAAGAAATLGAAAITTLTGCGGSNSSSAGTQNGATSPATSGAGGGGALAKLADVPVGSAISAQGPDGQAIVIAQPKSGSVVAFSAICTHQGCKVTPSGAKLNCPCHGSSFDAFTGAALKGPASTPLPSVSVKVDGADIVAG